MAAEVVDARAYRTVALRIHADLARAVEMHSECARGTSVAQVRWSRESYAESLNVAISRLATPVADPLPFGELIVAFSPLVRGFDPPSGRCLNDAGNSILSAREVDIVMKLRGSRCAELDASRMQAIEHEHALFRRGILALTAPVQAAQPELIAPATLV